MMRHREDRRRWPDADLLSAIAARDGAAFGVFYRRHLPVVLAFLLRQTGDCELTADLAAEVFAAVLLSAPGYRRQRDSAAPYFPTAALARLARCVDRATSGPAGRRRPLGPGRRSPDPIGQQRPAARLA
jgi:RNA polymerase sigma-70 factor (ECF subfamily)